MLDNLELKKAKILIIDDEQGNNQIMNRLLRNEGYEKILSITDPNEALSSFKGFRPDLTILDMKMPEMGGLEVMGLLKRAMGNEFFPILILTAQIDRNTKINALESGATDFIAKPIDQLEAMPRIRNLIQIRLLNKKNTYQNYNLEQKILDRTKQLEDTRLEIILRLGRAAEYRDNETGQHVLRMSHLCAKLGKEIGLPDSVCQVLLHASPLHDVGKIGIPDHILLKAGKLSEEDWEIMKLHPEIGAEILSGSKSQTIQMAETISLSHQERWDGSGYPKGLKGADIPIVGRIAAVCDVFDALTSVRPYKKAFSIEKSVKFLEDNSGKLFDPELVRAFIKALPEMIEIIEKFKERPEEIKENLKVYRLSPIKEKKAC